MKLVISIALAVAVIFLSCKHDMNSVSELKTNPASRQQSDFELSPAAADSTGQAASAYSSEEAKSQKPFSVPPKKSPPPVPQDWDKKIIRNADISVEVSDFKIADKSINEAVRLSGGYIASSTEQTLDDQIKSELTIRVPREKFDELVNQIASYGKNLLQKNITSQDVTEEWVDTKSRINTREKVLSRYYDFLHQAKKIDEVLEVQDQINGIQEEIDVATGRVNYINHQSALSTIHLMVFQKFVPTIHAPETPGFFVQLILNLKEGWEFCQMLLLGLVRIWPFYILLLAIWWLVKRYGKLSPARVTKPGSNV